MAIVSILYYLNSFIWLFPPVRQYKGRYFYFFLVLALLDPAALLAYKCMGIPFYSIYTFGGFLCLVSLAGIGGTKNYIYSAAIFLLLVLNLTNPFNLRILVMIENIIIIYFVLIITIQFYNIHQRFSHFHLVLLFYEATIITKFLFLLLTIKTGAIYFYVTSFFDIFAAIYFCIVKGSENKVILLPLNSASKLSNKIKLLQD